LTIYPDNEQYLFIDPQYKPATALPTGLMERYTLALLEWESVQDELAEIYKAQ
jgi:hypothetical protein